LENGNHPNARFGPVVKITMDTSATCVVNVENQNDDTDPETPVIEDLGQPSDVDVLNQEDILVEPKWLKWLADNSLTTEPPFDNVGRFLDWIQLQD